MQISRRILAPTGLASVTLDEVKEHLRVTHDTQDTYITALAGAAEDLISDLTNIQLRECELDIYFDKLLVDIPIYPIITPIENDLEYWDETDYAAFTASQYDLIMTGGKLRIYISEDQFQVSDLPVKYRYHIILSAGFQNGVKDKRIELAVMMLIAHWYNNNVPVISARTYKIPYSLQTIIWNLKGIIFHEVS